MLTFEAQSNHGAVAGWFDVVGQATKLVSTLSSPHCKTLCRRRNTAVQHALVVPETCFDWLPTTLPLPNPAGLPSWQSRSPAALATNNSYTLDPTP